jgi:hypothetical protein
MFLNQWFIKINLIYLKQKYSFSADFIEIELDEKDQELKKSEDEILNELNMETFDLLSRHVFIHE